MRRNRIAGFVDVLPLKDFTVLKDDQAVGYVPGSVAGAIPNERRIVKVWSEEGDANPNGTMGKVLSSIELPESVRARIPSDPIGYFVIWDTRPDTPVFVRGSKIREVE